MKHGIVQYREGIAPSEFAALLRSALLSNKVVVASGIDPTREQRPFWDEVSDLTGQCMQIGEQPSGERTGEKWMEVRYDPRFPNAYRHSKNAQPMHTDGSYWSDAPDVVFFYCLRQASAGGETTFLDSLELIDLLKAKDRELFQALESTPIKFSKADDFKTRPVITHDAVGPIMTWNYHCVDPNESPEVKALAERFHSFLQREVVAEKRALPIHLQPGQAVFFHDERLIHGRNAFSASQENDRFFWKTGFKFKAA